MHRLTFTTSIGLYELVLRACLFKLGGQPSQLWKHLVDYADFRSKIVLVNVKRQMATDEAYRLSVCDSRYSFQIDCEGRGLPNIPRPPMIKTAGFLPSDILKGDYQVNSLFAGLRYAWKRRKEGRIFRKEENQCQWCVSVGRTSSMQARSTTATTT